MAKGDVTLRFDAATAAAVQNILAARNATEAAANKLREFGDQAEHAGNKAHSAFEKIGHGATELAVTITGISGAMSLAEKAIEGLKKTTEEYFSIREEKTKTLFDQTRTVDSALAAARQTSEGGAVHHGLEGMKHIAGMNVNPEERNQLFAAISNASPYATAQDKLAATRVALTGRAGNMDMTAAGTLGATFATLSRERHAGGAMEGKSDDELANMAYMLPGGIEGRNLTFFQRAKDKNQAMQLIAAAGRSNEAAKALIQLQTVSEEGFDPGKVAKLQKEVKHAGKRATEDQKRELRLAQLQPEDRINAVLGDETLVAAPQRAAVRDLRDQMQHLPTDQSLSRDVRHLIGSETEAGRLSRQQRNQEAISAQMRETNAEDSAREQIDWERRKLIAEKGLPTGFKWTASAVAAAGYLDKREDSTQNNRVDQTPRTERNEVHETLKGIHDTLKEQTTTQRTTRTETLSNNSKGQE